MKPSVPAFRACLSPCRMAALLLALLALPLQPAMAGIAEGDLRLLWTPDPDHPKVLVIHTPAAGYRLLPLDAADSHEHLFRGLPAGIVRLDLHSALPGALSAPLDVVLTGRDPGLDRHAGRLLESWEVHIGTDRVTTVRLDSASGRLSADQASAAPFGNELIWNAWELQTLPHYGTEAVLPLDTRAGVPADPILNGRDLRRQASIRPRALRIDGDPSLVQLPLSGRSAAHGSGAMQTATYRASPALVRLQTSIGAQAQVTSQGRLSFSSFAGSRNPFEVDAVFQNHSTEDAGPIGILDDRLKGNDLRAMEARVRAFARPWGHGLAEMEFYAFGQERSFYLREFHLIPERAPRQDRADLLAALAYTLPVQRHTLSLGLSYSRAYMETGGGEAYDNIENYSLYGDPEHNAEASEDGLYWNPGELGRFKTHVYNYYTKHVIGTWQMSVGGRLALLDSGPMRAGLEYSRSTYRWYEHSNPVEEYNPNLRDEDGYRALDYASHLGYSWDPSQRVDSGLHSPPKPTQISLFASQPFPLGGGSIEAGARLEHFRPGQRPVLSMMEPAGENQTLEEADLGDEPSDTGIDPRIGLHLPIGKAHLWADLVQSRVQPPFDALYYSPNVLRSLDYQIRSSDGSYEAVSNLIFGNPALGAEVRRAAHLGFQRPLGESWNVTLAGTLARTSDTWVAKAYPNGNGFLYAYDNEGNRREQSLDVGLDYRPGRRTLVRLLYGLSRIETNVIEPAPLYRGLLIPGGPLEGTASRETAPLAPVWISDGEADEYHPSLFDRTHRIAAVFLARIDGGNLGPALGPLFNNSDLGLTVRAASGAPYTPTYIKPEGFMTPVPEEQGTALTPGEVVEGAGINSGRMPWTWTIDMRLRRYIRLWGSNWTADLQALNLLDRRNVRRVYGATGKADDDGWLDVSGDPRAGDEGFVESYQDRLNNPWNYEDGLTARISLSYTY